MATHPFLLEQERLEGETLAHYESLFALGNGRLGLRGFPPSRTPAFHPGVFINGFYESFPIPYGEDAHGFARTGQTMLDLPDCRYLTVSVDGETVDLAQGAWRRTLDMERGVLTERLRQKGIAITWETLLSMEHPSYGMLRVTIEAEGEREIAVHSSIALATRQRSEGLDPRLASLDSRTSLETLSCACTEAPHMGFTAHVRTKESGLSLHMGAIHSSNQAVDYRQSIDEETRLPVLTISFSGNHLVVEKLFFYQQGDEETIEHSSWDELSRLQEAHWRRFWEASDVVIEGDDEIQKAIRFNLFQLHQSVGRDGKSSLAAKGLTGLGYEGQYFWDTEIYAMPFFTHTDPTTARALIAFRISILDHARSRARELSQRGALFPWRTIGGMEASAYFPASTAQYHINADIAYALLQYLVVTGDRSILDEGGYDLLVETARLWVDLGFYNERKGGKFCIHEVTGPDEYSALVDNNLYTNVMAAYHLEHTARLLFQLSQERPAQYAALAGRLDLKEEEIDAFQRAASSMYIPFDEAEHINAQDDRFLTLQEWDEKKSGKILHPMLLHYHPLVIYRHRLIKQADITLAMVLQSQRFPWYLRRRNFVYYERYTTGDSSLSAAAQAVAAFDVHLGELGLRYLSDTALMDIADLHGNTKDGLHTAAMAGSWMTVVSGVAGYRLTDGIPCFRPLLPKGWKRLSFTLRFGKVRLTIDITELMTTYRTDGPTLTICHRSTPLVVNGQGCTIETRARIKAVIFDLDGVITSTDAYHYRAWKRLADEQGWHFDEQINQQMRGISRLDSLKVILAHNGVSLTDEELFALTEEKNRWYRSSLEELTSADILEGIPALLEELQGRGIKLAIASASANASFIVEKLGIGHSFDSLVPAGEVLVGKPDPEVFARAADELGLCGEECCGIEDAPAGIAAIKAAGMRAIGVGGAVDPAVCDVHVANTALLRSEMLLNDSL